MKIVKRLLLVFLILLVLILGSAIALPFIFKDRIVELAKQEINKTVNAKVDFQDVSLSLLRSFPDFNLRLKGFSVQGVDEFEGVQLAGGEAAELTLDLMSVVNAGRPIEIKSIRLKKPDVHVYVLENGKANYDIAKPAEAPAEPTPSTTDYTGVKVELDEYSITGGKLVYDDRSLGVYVEALGISHEGAGNFTIDIYDLDTHTDIESLTVEYGGITYLKEAATRLDAIFNVDSPNSKYSLKDNQLRINELDLKADGFVQLDGDNYHMDLTFSTPENDFKSLLSMIPNAYIEGYEDVKAEGAFTLSGEIRGTYNGEQEAYPAFRIETSVSEGSVQYPGLPLGITNINTQALVNSPGSNFDSLTVDVPRFSMKLGNNPFEAHFNLKTPVSDPDVAAAAKGVINLAELAQAFPMEGLKELNGSIKADLRVDTRLSTIEQERYEDVNMDGQLQLTGMNYRTEGMPPVKISNLQMAFTPRHVRLDDFTAMLGKSDVRASGTIDNILAYFSPKKTMKGRITLRSNYLLADEWIPEEEAETTAEAAPALPAGPATEGATTAAAAETAIFDRFDFSLDAEVKELVYGDYKVRNGVARGNIKPNRLAVNQLSGQIGDSDFSANGVITNLFRYLFEDGVLGGQLALQSRYFNLNQFMEEEEEAPAGGQSGSSAAGSGQAGSSAGGSGEAATAYSTIPVPPNIEMTATAKIDKVVYTNMALEDVQGDIVVADEAVVLDGVTARGLGGTMAMSGSYDTKDIDNPGFSFKYDLQKLDFQQAFNTLNTFQQLAPIGKYIKGTFSSTMIMDGKLGSDMMPKLESLNAEGFLETINGIIQGFTPTRALGEKLNVDYFKEDIRVTNTRNWFEVKNGVLELKEYDAKLKDIKMRIGGTYSLADQLNLKVKARVPRKLLEKNAVGAAASSGFNLIQQQASKLGLNIKQGEFVNVLVGLTGDMMNPKVDVKLLGMDGEGEQSLAESVKEDAKTQAKEQLETGKQAAKQAAGKAVDSLKTVAGQKVDQAKKELQDKATDAAKEKLGSVLDSTAQKKAGQLLEGAGKEGTDKIKENLEKWNPFGKKKDKGGG